MATSIQPIHVPGSTPQISRQYCGDHAVQFYEKDSSLLEEITRFVGAALASGEAAIIVATREHREAIAAKLRALPAFDLDRAVSQDRYIALDAQATLSKFLTEDHLDISLFEQVIASMIVRAKAAVEGEKQSVVVFGEVVALLCMDGKPETAVALEELWNGIARKHAFRLLCAYPMKCFGREEDNFSFTQICAAHSHVIPSESYTALKTEEERSRSIARLQRKEQVHDGLQRAKEELEAEIVQRTKAEQRLRESEQSLRDLCGSLLRGQEEERRHFGRKLREDISQDLVALKMDLGLLEPAAGALSLKARLRIADCRDLVERSLKQIRTLSHLLYPPLLEEMGLSIAIPGCLDGFSKRSGIETKLEMPDTVGRLPAEVELVIFRVLQGCLINVHRHSRSSQVRVRLSLDNGAAHIEVWDNGKETHTAIFQSIEENVDTLGVGFRGLLERLRQLGGNLQSTSSDEGTTVIATVLL